MDGTTKVLDLRLGKVLAAYGVALVLTVLVSWGWVALAFAPPYFDALLIGWVLTVLNAAVGLLIKWIATGRGLSWFLIWAIGVSGLRLLILLLIIIAVHRGGMAPFLPFVISLFTGFFACMACEIGVLYGSSAGT